MKKYKALKFIIPVIILGLLLSFLGFSFYYKHFLNQNVSISADKEYLYLYRKSNTQDVINQLIAIDAIKDTAELYAFMIRKNYQGRNIVPGKYKLSSGWTNNRLIDHLRAGNGKIDTRLIITQARNLKHLARQLAREVLLDSAKIYDFISNKDSMLTYGFNKETQICMFIPNTYFVDWDITLKELSERIYDEYQKFWTPERLEKAQAVQMSKTEVITLASIVYWETKMAEDIPVVAGVYMNRLRLGMPLQADPTLIFALDDYSIKRVLNIHKQVESPYNTYKYNGLPPGPILIPPIKYIDGVLNYAKHSYIFFVAKEDFSGYSNFSETYAEHQAFAKKYRNAFKERFGNK